MDEVWYKNCRCGKKSKTILQNLESIYWVPNQKSVTMKHKRVNVLSESTRRVRFDSFFFFFSFLFAPNKIHNLHTGSPCLDGERKKRRSRGTNSYFLNTPSQQYERATTSMHVSSSVARCFLS